MTTTAFASNAGPVLPPVGPLRAFLRQPRPSTPGSVPARGRKVL
jgi:hypothetical protein